MANDPAPFLPRVLVAGLHAADVEAACRAIPDTVAETSSAGPDSDAEIVLREVAPDVVVLVYDSLEKAEQEAAALRAASDRPGGWFRSVVACRVGEVDAAFAACRRGAFDDYAPFWPEPVDAHRLAMTVVSAARGAPARPGAGGPADAAAPTPPIATGGGARILVVEDDPLAAELIGKALAIEGVEVRYAADAPAAQEALRGWRPTLVLMDIGLPGMDGLSLTQWMKSSPALADIPVVMLTGEARRETIERSRVARADGFIVKPFTRQGLLVKLHPYLRRTPPALAAAASG